MLCYCVIEGCCLTLMELSHCTQCTAHTLHAVDCYITKFEHDATKYQITCNEDRKVERAKQELITLAMRLQLFYFSLKKRTAPKKMEQSSKTFAVMCFESMFFHSKIHVYERIMVKKVRRTRSNGKNANMVPIIRIRNANEIMNLLTFFAFISTLSKWAQATDRFLTVVTFPVKSTVQMTWFTAMISE